MNDSIVYCNDRDREEYEERFHFFDEDEVDQNILWMINIIDDYDFLIKL